MDCGYDFGGLFGGEFVDDDGIKDFGGFVCGDGSEDFWVGSVGDRYFGFYGFPFYNRGQCRSCGFGAVRGGLRGF